MIKHRMNITKSKLKQGGWGLAYPFALFGKLHYISKNHISLCKQHYIYKKLGKKQLLYFTNEDYCKQCLKKLKRREIKTRTFSLDVACGDNPKGDVNCDLYPQETWHRRGRDGRKTISSVPNFVRCDCHSLPFKNDVFKKVFCYHLIEHRDVHPYRLIKELLRVTNDFVEIRCPHRFEFYEMFRITKRPFHARHLSGKWFEVVFRNYTRKINYVIGIFGLPNELRASIRKKARFYRID